MLWAAAGPRALADISDRGKNSGAGWRLQGAGRVNVIQPGLCYYSPA